MDKAANNALYAVWLNGEVKEIIDNVDKLPSNCFLWIEDKENRKKWHLPYREGSGGINPDTNTFVQAGPVNLNVLKSIDKVIKESSSYIPKEIKNKITKLLKEFNIRGNDMQIKDILEASLSGQFVERQIDSENRLIKNVLLMNKSTKNIYFPGSKGTNFSKRFLTEMAENIDGKKWYKDHISDEKLKENRGVRSINDLLGTYRNGRIDESGLPRADIKYMKHQSEFVESVMEEADKVGLSIVARGPMSLNKQTGFAEAISLESLGGADLVTEPGSTNNMFESENRNHESEEEVMDYDKITVKDLLENRPDIVKSVEKGIQEKMSSKEEVDNLNNQIKALTESEKKLKNDLDEFQVKEAATKKAERVDTLLEESKIPATLITSTFRESLIGTEDEDIIKKLIEDRKTLVKPSKKQVHDMGDHTEFNEGEHENELSDEDLEKQMIESAQSRG